MIIAMDGGGTKNEYAAVDNTGHIIKRAVYKGTNAAELGVRRVYEDMKEQLADFTEEFGGVQTAFDGFFAGISGGGSPAIKNELNRLLKSRLPNTRIVENGSDTLNAYYAEAGSRPGISVVSGTGSVVFGITGSGTVQVGGWGPLVDDGGSGFVIARTGLMHAFRYADGRGEYTLLTELFEREIGEKLTNSIPILYKDGRSGIAALSRVVFDGWDAGDKIAAEVIKEALHSLREHVAAMDRHFPDNMRLPCVVSGGTFKNDRFFRAFRDVIDQNRYEVIRAARAPVIGAAIHAAELCSALSDTFETNIKLPEVNA